jgi:hypothetical protein
VPPNPVTPTAEPSREVWKSVAQRISTSTAAGGSAGAPARRSHASTSVVASRTAPRAMSSSRSPAGLSSRTSQRTWGTPKARARSSTASIAECNGPDGRKTSTEAWYSK